MLELYKLRFYKMSIYRSEKEALATLIPEASSDSRDDSIILIVYSIYLHVMSAST